MHLLLVIQQAERIDQPDQAKIMIAMKVGNKNMGDLAPPDLIIDQLYLRALTAVYQVVAAIQGHYLAGGMAVKGRYCRIISEDRYSEHEMTDDFGVFVMMLDPS